MPYNVKNYKGTAIASVLEGTVNTQTSLNLVGQNYKGYGELIAENFVHILENFARDTAPTNPTIGQLWYKPADGHLYILDQDANAKTKWKSMATIDISSTNPVQSGAYTPREGDFWFNSASDKGILNIRYKDDETGELTWGQLSVPVSADATLLFQTIFDDTGNTSTPPSGHHAIKFVVDNRVLAIYSAANESWSPLGKVTGNPLTVTSGGSSISYSVEAHPDGIPLHLTFPVISAGLTLSGPYDPNVLAGSQTVEAKEYTLEFSEPTETDGTTAEGYPLVSATSGAVTDIVITNQGSGYSGSPTAIIPPGQNSGTAPTLVAVIGDGEYEDKIVSVTVQTDEQYRITNNLTGSAVQGGTGYYTPATKPALTGSVRVGSRADDFIDLRNIQAGFGRRITKVNIVVPGANYEDGTAVTFSEPTGEGSAVRATGTIICSTDPGPITGITITNYGDGYVAEPTVTTTTGDGTASLQAVLGDNRLLLDANAISGDKIHAGNISQFASSTIADNTNWQRNDPSIEGFTLEDGYDGSGETTVHNDDQVLWNSVETITGDSSNGYEMTITDESNPLTRRRAGYAEVAFEREQTIGTSGNSNAAVNADGAFRVLGGAHVQKNLQVNGDVTVRGNILTGGSVSLIENQNLAIQDNLIQLNYRQKELGDNSLFTGVSGLYVDRGKSGGAEQAKAVLLWDDTNDPFSQADFWKLGKAASITESTTDTEIKSPDSIPVNGFALGNLDVKQILASEGGKLDIVSDHRTHASASDRGVGGHLTSYNGFTQDVTSNSYPYNNEQGSGNQNDFILIDQDERIIRGEFRFYRDAFPTDGSDSLINGTTAASTGGTSSSKVSNLMKDGTFSSGTATYMRGSGGPHRYGNPGGNAVNVTNNSVTWDGSTSLTGFLEDPIWKIDTGKYSVALREGRSIGWNGPRVYIHDTSAVPGTGAFIMPTVTTGGAIASGGQPVLTSGRHYGGNEHIAVVGESRDISAASSPGIATGGMFAVTYTSGGTNYGSGVVSSAQSAAGADYRMRKPFKEINATKHNGVFCADPSQISATEIPQQIANNPHVTDNTQKYVGMYPVMDGHNDGTFNSIEPFDGSGMTIGYAQGHFVDAYIKNIRVENPWNAEESFSILNRATHSSGSNAKAKININAVATHVGAADIFIGAYGGPTNASGGSGTIQIHSSSQGDNVANVYMHTMAEGDTLSSIDIIAKTDGAHEKGTQMSQVYVKAYNSKSTDGNSTFPYGQRTCWDGVLTIGGNPLAKDGNAVHIQATNMVVIEGTANSTGRTENSQAAKVERFVVDATDTFIHGDVHLGGTSAPETEWSANVYFNADIGSHMMPSDDADDLNPTFSGKGWDLGATDYEASLGSHHAGLTDNGSNSKRRFRAIYTRGISAGDASTKGHIAGDWSLTSGSTFQSTYTADLAERYEADDVITPGTVVAMGGDKEITATTTENDTEVFGVISTDPAFILNGGAGTDETHPMVAMTGRCPCKVVGKINKGDRLVSSSTPGRARKADLTNDSVFAIIGRAIEAHDSDGEGTIEIAVTRN